MGEHILQVRGLSKAFTLHALGGKTLFGCAAADFSLGAGEFVAVSGASGSGKSTLLKCIYRTYRPTAGSAVYHSTLLGPVDLARCSDGDVLRLRREEVSYVSQFLRVIPRVSAVDVVAEPLWARGAERAQGRQAAAELLLRLGIPRGHLDTYPALFSGGEQQRVNIARAVVLRPRLLLLDEPTASLDSHTGAEVVRVLAELKASGTSMVGVFHDMHTVRQLVDTELRMEPAGLARAAQQAAGAPRGGLS